MSGLLGGIPLTYGTPIRTEAATTGAVLQCSAVERSGSLVNQAQATYTGESQAVGGARAGTVLVSSSPRVTVDGGTAPEDGAAPPLEITALPIVDGEGNLVFGIANGAIALRGQLESQGLAPDLAAEASGLAAQRLTSVAQQPELQLGGAIATVEAAITEVAPEFAAGRQDYLDNTDPVTALMGFTVSALESLGFEPSEATAANNAAQANVAATPRTNIFLQVVRNAYSAAIRATPTQVTLLTQMQDDWLTSVADPETHHPQVGDRLIFPFEITQASAGAVEEIQIPNAETLAREGVTGPGVVTQVRYVLSTAGTPVEEALITTEPRTVLLGVNQQLLLEITTEVTEIPEEPTPLTAEVSLTCGAEVARQGVVLFEPLPISPEPPLIDPLGQILGCNGEVLADYSGFSFGIYFPAPGDTTGGVQGLLPLVPTELPDNPANTVPEGIAPNTTNINPFPLANDSSGRFNFLLSESQLAIGSTYILLVQPPEGSIYAERRVRLEVIGRNGDTFSYRATSLDGLPISTTDAANPTVVEGTFVTVQDATNVGITLVALNLISTVCEAEDLRITKTGDRAAAEPGDVLIYRITVRNLSTVGLDDLVVTDTLPRGFQLKEDSVRAGVGETPVTVTLEVQDRLINFRYPDTLLANQVLAIAYAAQLTPDALRGSGRNTALVNGVREDNGLAVKDGPVSHRVRLDPGILTDKGTIIGRVFVDQNFDGEQQRGEPGVPNAVIILDDGLRVATDADGLFSVRNVDPGYRVGTLDLTSLPGYHLAPNRRFKERRSESRLVRLAPGSLVRMNFAVTPAAKEQPSR